MMLVGIWFGLYWVLFSVFDHYMQSSVRGASVQQSSVQSSVQPLTTFSSVLSVLYLPSGLVQFSFTFTRSVQFSA